MTVWQWYAWHNKKMMQVKACGVRVKLGTPSLFADPIKLLKTNKSCSCNHLSHTEQTYRQTSSWRSSVKSFWISVRIPATTVSCKCLVPPQEISSRSFLFPFAPSYIIDMAQSFPTCFCCFFFCSRQNLDALHDHLATSNQWLFLLCFNCDLSNYPICLYFLGGG